MDQSQSLQAARRRPEAVKAGNDDLLMIAHDNAGNLPSPADEDTDLPVDTGGQLRKGPCKFVGHDTIRRDFSPIESLNSLDVFRF
jgi:hypothetical protein